MQLLPKTVLNKQANIEREREMKRRVSRGDSKTLHWVPSNLGQSSESSGSIEQSSDLVKWLTSALESCGGAGVVRWSYLCGCLGGCTCRAPSVVGVDFLCPIGHLKCNLICLFVRADALWQTTWRGGWINCAPCRGCHTGRKAERWRRGTCCCCCSVSLFAQGKAQTPCQRESRKFKCTYTLYYIYVYINWSNSVINVFVQLSCLRKFVRCSLPHPPPGDGCGSQATF